MRNYAIQPLIMNRINVDYVLFLNYVFFCYDDILELLHQQTLNSADLVGGMDYLYLSWKQIIFYDSWVTQDVNGTHPEWLELQKGIAAVNPPDRKRVEDLLPVQMMCLWNGMVSINARVFKNIEFRRGLNGRKGDTTPGESSANEITSLCIDMIRHGFDKLVMVPQVKVAYDLPTYDFLKYKDNDFVKSIRQPQRTAGRKTFL
eukprot:NODE_105_length_19900_cov_0.306550.p8 type:complete len:203 gc:universal NODE_105_length_19900_cov_0.306550:1393-785(-)